MYVCIYAYRGLAIYLKIFRPIRTQTRADPQRKNYNFSSMEFNPDLCKYASLNQLSRKTVSSKFTFIMCAYI